MKLRERDVRILEHRLDEFRAHSNTIDRYLLLSDPTKWYIFVYKERKEHLIQENQQGTSSFFPKQICLKSE